MSDPDIVVLRQTIHGSGGAELAAAIRERLPDRSVALARTPTEERELLETARIAVGLDIDEEQLAAAENLELFACVFAGTGHLPRDALADHGVALTNASGVPRTEHRRTRHRVDDHARPAVGARTTASKSAGSGGATRRPKCTARPSPSSGSARSARPSSTGWSRST